MKNQISEQNEQNKSNFRKFITFLTACSCVVFGSVSAFADTSVSSVAVTSDQLQPIVSAVTENIGVILPIAISIFGIFFGIKLIPKLINMFKRG